MKVIVTVDYYDGRASKSSKPVDIDELASFITYMRIEHFMNPAVCGVTITKCERLDKIADKMRD